MALKILDERHKRLAEEMLRGTPRSTIAKDLGVDRSTLYVWMKDPLWQKEFTKQAEDLAEARKTRFVVTVMKAAEVTEVYLDYVLDELRTKDRDRIQTLPGLDAISTALKRITEVERLDAGQPTSIREERGATPAQAEEGKRIKQVLDRIVKNPEETQH